MQASNHRLSGLAAENRKANPKTAAKTKAKAKNKGKSNPESAPTTGVFAALELKEGNEGVEVKGEEN